MGSYWWVALHVAAAADGIVEAVKVDWRQILLWKAVAQAATQTPRTLTAFRLWVVQRNLKTHTQKKKYAHKKGPC